MIGYISLIPNPTKHPDPWVQALDTDMEEEVSEIHTVYTIMGTVVVAITVPITAGFVYMRITLCLLAWLPIQPHREIEDMPEAPTSIRWSSIPQ